MNNNIFKVIGIAATCVGFGVTLVSDYASEKRQEIIIEEKVNEALAKREREKA